VPAVGSCILNDTTGSHKAISCNKNLHPTSGSRINMTGDARDEGRSGIRQVARHNSRVIRIYVTHVRRTIRSFQGQVTRDFHEARCCSIAHRWRFEGQQRGIREPDSKVRRPSAWEIGAVSTILLGRTLPPLSLALPATGYRHHAAAV